MKILLVSKSKPHTRIYAYFKKAFERQGHTVCWVKYLKLRSYFGEKIANLLVNLLATFHRSDLLFFHGKDISYKLLIRLKKQMPAIMYFDDVQRNDEQLKILGRCCDIMYLTARGEVAQYNQWGINARFIQGGCDPDAHYKVQTPDAFYQSEVAFIGQADRPERIELMREIGKRFDMKLWGQKWETAGMKVAAKEVFADEYRKICAGAKIILGFDKADATVDLYFSNRTWYTLGCGGFLLTTYCPSLEEMFGRGRELDWFETLEECCEKIAYYLDHDEERQRIATAGYQLAHSQYSYENMVEKIIADLNKIQLDAS
jgi:spore maturation protein CgeB